MTQAFNLSQLANNLNSSGQLDATDGLVNAVPVSNGGTGGSSLTGLAYGNGTSAFSAATSNQVHAVIGTLPVSNGGTGATSITTGALVKGNGTSAFTAASAADIVSAIGSTAVANATSASNGGVTSVDSQTGAITLSSLTAFAKSLGTSGYQKLPGGLIIQWGSNSAGGSGAASVSFPISFPTACVNVQVTGGYSGTNGNSTGAYSVTTSGFTYTFHYSGTTDYWLAIGY